MPKLEKIVTIAVAMLLVTASITPQGSVYGLALAEGTSAEPSVEDGGEQDDWQYEDMCMDCENSPYCEKHPWRAYMIPGYGTEDFEFTSSISMLVTSSISSALSSMAGPSGGAVSSLVTSSIAAIGSGIEKGIESIRETSSHNSTSSEVRADNTRNVSSEDNGRVETKTKSTDENIGTTDKTSGEPVYVFQQQESSGINRNLLMLALLVIMNKQNQEIGKQYNGESGGLELIQTSVNNEDVQQSNVTNNVIKVKEGKVIVDWNSIILGMNIALAVTFIGIAIKPFRKKIAKIISSRIGEVAHEEIEEEDNLDEASLMSKQERYNLLKDNFSGRGRQ